MVGDAWEQKIVEDNWSFVITSKCQSTKNKQTNKKNWVFLKLKLVNKKATYSYQVSLTCIKYIFISSKAIKLLFILLVPLTII